jgi:hypothetical protein
MDAASVAQPVPKAAEPSDPHPADPARTTIADERLPPDAFLSAPIEIEDAVGGSDPYNHKGRLIAAR